MAISVNNNPSSTQEEGNVNIGNPVEEGVITEPVAPVETTAPAGLSATELNDPNSIKVTVSDPNIPIVVLYGPPSCGKTMTLVRMTRYLVSQGYTVVPEKTFRPAYDDNYRQLCENFDQMINSNDAASSTNNISFMLVKVLKNGRPLCQLLEAPGEYYFDPDKPNKHYPSYVYEILHSVNRKVWAIMIEPNWGRDSVDRANYVSRIRDLKSNLSPRDKVIFVYNKVDNDKGLVYGVGQVNIKQAITNVQNLFPNIFVPFENTNPITKYITKYNCEFVPFMTGSYTEKLNGGYAYVEGHYIYAKKLWQAMLKQIKG